MKNYRNTKRAASIARLPMRCFICSLALLLGSCTSKDATPSPTGANPKAQSLDSTVLVAQKIAVADEPSVASSAIENIWQTVSPINSSASAIGGSSSGAAIQGTQLGMQVQIKSVYSQNNVFFLVQYDDPTEDLLDRPLRFLGGDYMNAAAWILDTTTHDDGFSLMFEITPGVSGMTSFKTDGCTMACHTTQTEAWKPGMFSENKGRYDFWYWRSSTSNATGIAHDMISVGAPEYATRFDNPADEAIATNISNVTPNLPLFTVGGDNNGLDPNTYVSAQTSLAFGDIYNTVSGKKWAAGDIVPSLTIAKIDPQGTSDAWDVKSRGFWSNGKWTVKFKRALRTQSSSSGSPNDVAFVAGNSYPFSFAVHNNNAPGSHYGVASHQFTLLLKE